MSNESSNPRKFIIIFIFVLIIPVLFQNADGGKNKSGQSSSTTLVTPSWRHTLGLSRVRQKHLDMYSRYRKKFSEPMGIAACKHAFNDKPKPGDDDELTVYGVNSGRREIIFNTSQMSLGFFEGWPGEESGFEQPVDIATDREGWVAVSDAGRRQVIVLKNENNKLQFVRLLDFNGTASALLRPAGLAAEAGRLYIADSGNDRVVVTDFGGRYFGDIGAGGSGFRLTQPFDVAVIPEDTWNHYGSKFMVVTDSLGQRLSLLTMDGRLQACRHYRDISGDGGGFDFVAIDYYSNVYVTDTRGGCVYKFDRFLRYLDRFGCGGGRKTDLVEPRGITIYRRFGQVFIAERDGASYYWVGTDVQNLSAEGKPLEETLELSIRFTLTEHALVTLTVETASGQPVDTLAENQFLRPGNVVKSYQLGASSGTPPIANRKLNVSVTAVPTYSSKKHFSARRKVPLRIR